MDYRNKTTKPGGYHPTYILDKEDVNSRNRLVSSRNTTRKQANQARNQSTLMDYWPTLTPASLPVRHPKESRTHLLPRSLPNMGWKMDPTLDIRPKPNGE